MPTVLKPPLIETSISRKERVRKGQTYPWKPLTKTLFWTSLWLIALDVGIGILFPFPRSAEQSPSKLQQYFEYGRSIEGKLDRMVGSDVKSSDPIIGAGWVDPSDWQTGANTVDDGHLLVAIYGMSFSDHISAALTDIDDTITMRSISGPVAPPNHTFAAFTADTEGQSADVVVFSILASSIKRMSSISGMNWSYEHPAPYTYPYYTLDSDQTLVVTEPAISSADEFIAEFRQKGEKWQALKQQMRQYDQPFSHIVFDNNLSDRSAIFRLIRRGWANRARNQSKSNIFDPRTGFDPDSAEIKTLKVLVSEFVNNANAAEQQPIVLLIHDQGYSDSLYTVLEPQLSQLDTLVLSTHTVANTENPKNFIPDGHFTSEVNHRLGHALRDVIEQSPGQTTTEATLP